jgi:hypothetical protein
MHACKSAQSAFAYAWAPAQIDSPSRVSFCMPQRGEGLPHNRVVDDHFHQSSRARSVSFLPRFATFANPAYMTPFALSTMLMLRVLNWSFRIVDIPVATH